MEGVELMTEDQEKWLNWLRNRGGSGYVDRWGRVVAGGEVAAQGAATAWLKLIAQGRIVGGKERLTVAEGA